ncbi:MAG: chondroitin 4-sulfotransferase 11 [Halioglobus sp.]|jgi:hypothetical protein
MLISESHRFIFLAVPKTGTSSIENALKPYGASITRKFNKHATCLKLQRDLPSGMWDSYFKFAFVRNPYDLMQSWYFYRQRKLLANPEHPRHHLYTGDVSFETFIHSFAKNELMLRQVDFIAPHGKGLQVDRVGKFEDLDSDFSVICERLQLSVEKLPVVRSSNNNREASELWTPSARKVINEYFLEDFTSFDYEMIEK